MSESQQQSKANGEATSSEESATPTGRKPSRNERRASRQPIQQQKQQQAQPKQQQQTNRKGPAKQTAFDEDEAPRRLSLAEMFKEEEQQGEDVDDESQPPKDLKRVMKRLKLKPEQFDEVMIDMDGAEPIPFKTLRSRVGELVNLETEQVRFESERMRIEGENIRSREELREILALIPPDKLTPQLIDRVRRQHAEMQQRERQSTLDVIPAWSNQKVMEQDTAGMKKFVSNWGFNANWLDQITDHRAIKFIRDMYLRDLRIQKALAEVKTPDDSSQKGSSKAKGKGGTQKPQEERQTTRRSRVPTSKDRLMQMFTRGRQ